MMNKLLAQISKWESEISKILPLHLFEIIKSTSMEIRSEATEIRLRSGQPLILVLGNKDIMLTANSEKAEVPSKAYLVLPEDIIRTFKLMCKNSIYAYEEELKSGYLTVSGGHRVGFTGQAIVNNSKIKALKNISSLNIRIAKDIDTCPINLLDYLLTAKNEVCNTLIISPPRSGKTTLLRNIIRVLSNSYPSRGFTGVQVGVVDERSEIAASENGVLSIDLGPRTDVLDACPKAEGILMLIRSMAPQVVVTDELGRQEDASAIREALYAGVSVIATAHSRNLEELKRRPYIGDLIAENFFDIYIILSSKNGPGTIEEIIFNEHKAAVGKAGYKPHII
ncbi:stage III sporulation protein AA [Selenomonadales bacterium OttesenSCG-928-I06]|nr:stage III sporulation protein AA [Selenomonadales bacterium OttesenSCG-928-I06]